MRMNGKFISEYEALVSLESDSFAKIFDPTDYIVLAALEMDGLNLMHVDKQTVEMCMIAVNNHGRALKYVKEQSREICMAAIKNNIWSVAYVERPIYDDVVINCINFCPRSIVVVKNPSLPMIRVAATKLKSSAEGRLIFDGSFVPSELYEEMISLGYNVKMEIKESWERC